ncbi:hypothetical protein [Streptomyces fulvoviolaceus]|uniref:hypothetical protein n=1 Tax=Streptomyces fulvoviolaceus TaxID=285535 RepID=UPI00069409E2|nr:hypothetical protein [Streptomyces fulvoviolaceus]
MSALSRSNADQNSGLEITIALTPLETEAIGEDATLMAEILDNCLWAMGMLRTGINSRDRGAPAPTPGDWASALRGLDRLPPRVQGICEALIRAHAAANGKLEHLASATNVSTTAAQDRRATVTHEPPGTWEQWAATVRTPRPTDNDAGAHA